MAAVSGISYLRVRRPSLRPGGRRAGETDDAISSRENAEKKVY